MADAGLSVVVLERGQFPGAKNVWGGILYREPTEADVAGIRGGSAARASDRRATLSAADGRRDDGRDLPLAALRRAAVQRLLRPALALRSLVRQQGRGGRSRGLRRVHRRRSALGGRRGRRRHDRRRGGRATGALRRHRRRRELAAGAEDRVTPGVAADRAGTGGQGADRAARRTSSRTASRFRRDWARRWRSSASRPQGSSATASSTPTRRASRSAPARSSKI